MSTAASVLIVDDNPAKRLGLKAILTPLGYEIVEADSGRAALRCLMTQSFAVILLDVRMPDMDGFETAACIRQRRESMLTPIIFVTAHARDEVSRDVYAQGASDFLVAPFSPTELRAKVSAFANLYIEATERASDALQVKVAADQLRLIAHSAPIGIFQTDEDNRYVYTNPRWSEITGIPSEEAVGQRWDFIVGSEERESLRTQLPEGKQEWLELNHRFELRRPRVATRIAIVTSRSILDEYGRIAGWVGTLADVTVEAWAEAAMSEARTKADDASQLKSDFLANMSHEIRTPMNGVLGMIDLLLETDLDERQRDFAETVRDSGKSLLTIIDEILDFSKVEAGMLEIERIEFSLSDLVSDVVDLMAASAQAKGLELVAVVDRFVPAWVTGDPSRVGQVLNNLLSNAIKFTEEGEIVVRVSATEAGAAESVVRFEISDTGSGITAEKLAVVFEPFVQADSSTSRKYGGTGLGLAISSDLVELMGGEIGATSTPGEGSSFWFTIRAGATTQPVDARVRPNADLVGTRALVVDDSAVQRALVAGFLADLGLEVATAESGADALAQLRAPAVDGRAFAVVVADQRMPGMDGLQLAETIDAHPELTPRLVLMTNLGGEPKPDAARSGIHACLSKPVHLDDLRRTVLAALDLQRPISLSLESKTPLARDVTLAATGRLLLVEDNLINQKVAVAMLSSAGYEVDTATSGADAVEAVTTQTYDAILMDCQMPVMNGYEATAAIRAYQDPATRTPIIALTAGARREDRERCLDAGMDDYLSKPVNKAALLAVVAHSMAGSM